MLSALRAGLALCALASTAAAQTIYPLDAAHFVTGAKFDLKVEFPDAPRPDQIKVRIDGKDAAAVLGNAPQVVEREDGAARTAYWIRNAHLDASGTYVVEASSPGGSSTVTWQVSATPDGRIARNVILLVGDGLSLAHRAGARMLSKGIKQGRYGGELAMDDMPHMALVSTHGTDSIITDSANSMTAYTTGHKSCVNALGVYCAANRSTRGHPKVETIAELAKRRLGLAIGIVTDTEIEDATPAGLVAHTRARSDYDDIVEMFLDLKPDVILGGGKAYFLPSGEATPNGKRKDGQDYIAKFRDSGYAYVDTASELKKVAAETQTTKVLGLFNDRNIDGALDRRVLHKGTVKKFPDQPDLTQSTQAALEVLSRSPNGFLLMVEAGRIDKYSHSLDWERAVYDTIMLDNVVRIAKEFAAKHADTLVIVVPDHTHPVSIIGTYDDSAGEQLRDRLQTYASAGFPNYPPADVEGYPPSVDVSRRLAMVFAAYPDYCDPGKPYLSGENKPTTGEEGERSSANEAYCQPGAARKIGNLPFTARSGVHAAEDVVLTAMGPGADVFHGRVDNTFVFHAMARALGLGAER